MRWGFRCALLFGALLLVVPGSAAAFGPLGSFGGFGSGAGQLDAPQQLEVAADGDVYVVDSGNGRISVFAGDGSFVRTIGEGVLVNPTDVALAADGRAFVTDSGLDRVVVFSAAGAHIDDIDSADPALTDPVAVALAESRVYVAEGSDDSIIAYEDDGEPIGPITTPAVPRDVVIGGESNLFVAIEPNVDEGRIAVLTVAGSVVRDFGDEGEGQLSNPVALALDEGGQVYVADQGAEAVERFDAAGDYLGGFPSGPDPTGVATACAGNVFVVDEGLSRVERYGEPGTPVPPCAATGAADADPIKVSFVPFGSPSNRIRFNRLKLNRGNGSAVLFVRVAGPGQVILKGRGVRRLRRGASGATIVRLPVKPKVRLRHFVKRHGKGRIRVEVTFRPVGGEPRTIEKVIVLRRKR